MRTGMSVVDRGKAALLRVPSLVRRNQTPLLYAGSSVASSVAQLVAGFLVIRWITPEELGLWHSVRMAQIYAFILLAGINNGLGRELPFTLGKGDSAFAHRLAGTAFFCVTLASVVVLIGGVGCAFAFAQHGSEVVWAISIVTVTIALAFYHHIFTLTFRSSDSFKRLTVIQWVQTGLAVATVPLVYFFGYNGMLLRTVVLSAAVLSMLYYWRPMRVRVRLDREALKLLLKTGLPIFGLDYLKNTCRTLDKVVLLRMGGVEAVGMYGLAGVVLQTLGALPTALRTYMYPRMCFKYGESGDARQLWKYGIRFAVLATALTGLAAAGAWLILPHFVPVVLPKYVAGLPAARIVLLAGVMGGCLLVVDALWSLKIWKLMITFQISSALMFGLGPILGVLFVGKVLEGVAWGLVIGAAGQGVLALALTYYGTHRSPPVTSDTAKPSP